ncbi:hypothetical protein NONO_c52000 [Nocardia nova SH22a]|uniref:DUF3500 domain-containing protein n=1 Tax=Nocardia nova SH22a TaxID=1415166 RepID=W5TLH3_9NOCA|nr:DUF3500 domain-containing protein [Nocardia nova]AHH19984.1 hypothetical protein NONO_c52000 [Nocardia nova SH22a]
MNTELYADPETATKLLVIAMGLIDTFDPSQRAAAIIDDFDDPRRLDWDIIPRPDRTGIALHRLDRHQKVLVWDLIRSTVPLAGFTKILAIPQLEHVLRDLEHEFLGPALQTWRSSDAYFLTFFGRPGFEETWTLRFLGHHVCLNITVVDQHWIAATPAALGAQPTLDAGVLTPLADDEGFGFELLASLDEDQLGRAVIHDVAPADFVTRQVPAIGAYEYPDHYDLGMPGYTITDDDRRRLRFARDVADGIPGSELSPDQQAILWQLLDCYLGRLPDRIGDKQRTALRDNGIDDITFAWAGGQAPGVPHYFRVRTDRHLIESVNSVSCGDHLHTVLRDLDNDFGRALLASPDRSTRRGRGHLDTRTVSSAESDPGL